MASPYPDGVQLQPGRGGLERLIVDRPAARAELYLHGATLTAWQPAGRDPVLWISRESLYLPGKAIRGGVPICFPWFGPKAGDSTAPQHGFARTRAWTLESVREVSPGAAIEATLVLRDDDDTRALWPHRFRARSSVRISEKLELELAVENTGETSFSFEEALHTYFGVSDIHTIEVSGLEDTVYVDKVAGGAVKREGNNPLRIESETDRVYHPSSGACELRDPGLARRISVQKDGSSTTILWNPWIAKARSMKDFGDDEWMKMVCIESANAGAGAVTLAPGEAHVMRVRIVVNAESAGT